MAASAKSDDVLIINCDETYPLDSVHELVQKSSRATSVETSIERRSFSLPKLAEVSEEVKGKQLLCAILVLNAHESRLSINEKNAGIGYAVLYRALREASNGHVLVVIGGDEKSSAADRKVVSNWVRYKVASQFEDEYLDGRRGFVFSWGKSFYPVHEEACQQYLRAIGSGKDGLEKPFSPTVQTVQALPKTTYQGGTDTKLEERKSQGEGPGSAPVDSTGSRPLPPPPDTSPHNVKIPEHPVAPANSTGHRETQPRTGPSNETQDKAAGPPQAAYWQVLPEKRHPKDPVSSEATRREETEERLRGHVNELKKKYPTYRGKLLGVLKFGILDVGYTYALNERVLGFQVPKYMTKTFHDEKKSTPEVDVIIYEDPRDNELAFMYLDPSKSHSSGGWGFSLPTLPNPFSKKK
ncbi:uncharacterized protein LOC118419553 [Branchiostoma floridae]|uniref:Uncharacterized protein LOC118419553 n=1 Tax=Branchiostoma floridae TaxID=7739 RepID=A0A9J7LG75_BRAFL|nr:uncharacterized protein LOC118419553 [Branchiostoma floridae]